MAAKKASKKKVDSFAAWGKDLGDTINAYIKDGVDSLGLATKKDLESLDKRIKKLEAKKAPAKRKKGPAKRKKAPAKKKAAAKKKAPAKKKAAAKK